MIGIINVYDKEIDENCIFEVPLLKYYGNFDRKILQILFSSLSSIILGQKYFRDFMDTRNFRKRRLRYMIEWCRAYISQLLLI